MTVNPAHFRSSSHRRTGFIDKAKYGKWYEESIENPDKFWGKHGKRIDWFKPYTKVKNTSFMGKVSIKWFEDSLTNVSYNCIDRHLKTHGKLTAITWEGDNAYIEKKITYKQLFASVCRLANVLKKHGVKKDDRVTIYMPMIPEAEGDFSALGDTSTLADPAVVEDLIANRRSKR